MGGPNTAAATKDAAPLHIWRLLRRAWFNRAFTAVYGCAVAALLHRHLLYSTTATSLALLVADFVLAFMWATSQGFRVSPICRETFPENLPPETDFPAMDVFICTADPNKEPPMSVVNTALSVMAYEYPKEKLSVYVSDDGGSQLTLFAFMEAARFAAHWLPYCRSKKIVERCPEAYFKSDPVWSPETDKIKNIYDSMKTRVERVVERGTVLPSDCTFDDKEGVQAFSQWSDDFARRDHPTIIQVLLESGKVKDVMGHDMPNLVYLSREKRPETPHNFKAGALNTLLRVSAAMTNAPIILTVDCDMYSNDPVTPRRVLCYFMDPQMDSRLAFVQFPQTFRGINKNDIYGAEFKQQFVNNAAGMDGIGGPSYFGTGAFFRRRALFGPPTSCALKVSPELSPDYVVNRPIKSVEVLSLARHVSRCDFEAQTEWGSKLGLRYGTLVEDFYSSYRMLNEGWKSILCHPNRPAFLGDAPMNLNDLLDQTKRWLMGFFEVGFSKYSPMTYGWWYLNPLLAMCFTHYMYWSSLAIPVTIYSFLPQLALLNSASIFPKVSDPWFYIYAFLFLGTYVQDLVEFMLEGGTFQRWWNIQRMWIIRGLSSCTFSIVECFLKSIGTFTFSFNVTSKVVDDELCKRYERGLFEFGVASPMFLPVTTAAIVNLVSFTCGIVRVFRGGIPEDFVVQMVITSLMVVMNWPVYEGMILRTDKGKMPMKITVTSLVLASILYAVSTLAF